MIEAIQKNDYYMFMKCIDHGSNPNQILDEDKRNCK